MDNLLSTGMMEVTTSITQEPLIHPSTHPPIDPSMHLCIFASIYTHLPTHPPSTIHQVLLANDQLQMERKKNNVFFGFQEAPIHFQPTYKFDVKKTRSDAIPSEDDLDKIGEDEQPPDFDSSYPTSPMTDTTTTPVSPIFPDPFSIPEQRDNSITKQPETSQNVTGLTTLDDSNATTRIVVGDMLDESATGLTVDTTSSTVRQHHMQTPSLTITSSSVPATPSTPTTTTTSIYDSSKKQRIQSWTDRILYKQFDPQAPKDPRLASKWRKNSKTSLVGGLLPVVAPAPAPAARNNGTSVKVRVLDYNSSMEMTWSDHKPVYARFAIDFNWEEFLRDQERVASNSTGTRTPWKTCSIL